MIMGGVPRSKAGNAAAMEDTAYELGAVLGIAILGSLASFLYRRSSRHAGGRTGAGSEAVEAARDSLGGAVAVADAAQLPALAARAGGRSPPGWAWPGSSAG